MILSMREHLSSTSGQQHEATLGEHLIEHARGRAFIADTGYDADRIVAAARRKHMRPVICCNPTRKRKRRLDPTKAVPGRGLLSSSQALPNDIALALRDAEWHGESHAAPA